MNTGSKGIPQAMEIFTGENGGFQGVTPAEYYRYKLVIYPEGEAGIRVRDLVKEFQALSRKGIRVFQKPCITLAVQRRDLDP